MEWTFPIPAAGEIAEAILIANDVGMTPALARRTYDAFVDPKTGLYRNLALDMEGVRTVLALRSKVHFAPKVLNDPMKYVDLDLYAKAFNTPAPR